MGKKCLNGRRKCVFSCFRGTQKKANDSWYHLFLLGHLKVTCCQENCIQAASRWTHQSSRCGSKLYTAHPEVVSTPTTGRSKSATKKLWNRHPWVCSIESPKEFGTSVWGPRYDGNQGWIVLSHFNIPQMIS